MFDTPFPEPLYEKTPGHQPFGVALVLDVDPHDSLARITLTIEKDAKLAITQMDNPALEGLRTDSSASRSLPLLAAFAAPAAQQVVLSYADDLRLRIVVDRPPA